MSAAVILAELGALAAEQGVRVAWAAIESAFRNAHPELDLGVLPPRPTKAELQKAVDALIDARFPKDEDDGS